MYSVHGAIGTGATRRAGGHNPDSRMLGTKGGQPGRDRPELGAGDFVQPVQQQHHIPLLKMLVDVAGQHRGDAGRGRALGSQDQRLDGVSGSVYRQVRGMDQERNFASQAAHCFVTISEPDCQVGERRRAATAGFAGQ